MTLQEFINECLEDAKSRPKDMTLGQSVYRYIQKETYLLLEEQWFN